MNERTEKLAERLRKHFSGPMTAEEVEFWRDCQGFIDFAIRNGLNFAVIASTLGHDVNEIAREGFDLVKAKAHGFLPKVTGYSHINEEDFGPGESVD
jgi:hypothetical protein